MRTIENGSISIGKMKQTIKKTIEKIPSELERIIASIIYEKPPKGSYQEAIKFFSRAIEIKPNEIRNHFWLGKTYNAVEKPLLAKKEFEIVISLNPRDIDDKQTQANARTLLKKSF